MTFKFNLKQQVIIAVSGENAEVIGRSEYVNSENNYMLRYRSVDGRATEQWWAESALAAPVTLEQRRAMGEEGLPVLVAYPPAEPLPQVEERREAPMAWAEDRRPTDPLPSA